MRSYFRDFGLSPKEEKVYMTCLTLGTSPATLIAERSGLKRPTTYLILESLTKDGYLSLSSRHGVRQFKATDPADLAEIFAQKQKQMSNKIDLFRESIPELRAVQSKRVEQPKISFFSGQEAIKKIYNSMKVTEDWSAFFDSSVLESDDEKTQELRRVCWSIGETLSSQKMHARDIMVDGQTARTFRDQFVCETYQIRLIKISPFASDIIIFSDRVFLISYSHEMQLIEIQNTGIAKMQLAMYDALWDSLESSSV